MNRIFAFAFLSCFATAPVIAGEDSFTPGPIFEEFGPIAEVDANYAIPAEAHFKVSLDTNKQADVGTLHRTLVSAARFVNMHARAGVPVENIKVAVVVHGGATKDVTNAAYYSEAVGGENANAALIKALTEQGVQIVVCGQSAAYYDVGRDDLLPGVQMALSAMTAHALLQQDGYTLNPF